MHCFRVIYTPLECLKTISITYVDFLHIRRLFLKGSSPLLVKLDLLPCRTGQICRGVTWRQKYRWTPVSPARFLDRSFYSRIHYSVTISTELKTINRMTNLFEAIVLTREYLVYTSWFKFKFRWSYIILYVVCSAKKEANIFPHVLIN